MKSRAAVMLLALSAVRCGAGVASTTPVQPPPMPTHFQSGDIRLAFTLDLPEGRGPFPAIVAGHGSGRMTRDQLRWLSDRFTRFGFAVLRFDKRGVGESGGEFVFVGTNDSPVVFPQLAADIAAGVRFLRTRPEIDPQRIGLAGNSQAGWILPLVARDLGDIAFMVLHSGPVCTVGEEMFYSNLVENNTTTAIADANKRMSEYTGPPGYDPVPVLEAVRTPTLWVLGLADRSIPIELTLANLQKLKAVGKPFEWRTYEGLDHSLGPQVWPDVGAWVAKFK
jgi:uncharacterized protein